MDSKPIADLHSFAPTLARLAELHADAVASNWRVRPRRCADLGLDFADLHIQDTALQGALDALCLLGEPADAVLAARCQAPLRPADLFVLASHALRQGPADRLAQMQGLAQAMPEHMAAWASALEWAPANAQTAVAIEQLPGPWRLRVSAARADEFPELHERCLSWLDGQSNPEIVIHGLMFLRQRGVTRYLPMAGSLLAKAEPPARQAAAEWLLTLGGAPWRDAATQALFTLADHPDPAIHYAALRCLALHAPDYAHILLPRLPDHLAGQRLRVQMLGWLGEASAVPTLRQALDVPALRRLAGGALALLTGSRPQHDGWRAPRPSPAPEAEHALPADDTRQDDPLPWPDAAGFDAWLARQTPLDPAAGRYFAGRPLTLAWATQVLARGPLPWRALAAEHCQRLRGQALFPVHLPAAAQSARLALLTQGEAHVAATGTHPVAR